MFPITLLIFHFIPVLSSLSLSKNEKSVREPYQPEIAHLASPRGLVTNKPFSQTSNNGLWTPSLSPPTPPTPPTTAEVLWKSAYQSWTTWTSVIVYGTVTATITSTVPCGPAPVWVTTTQYTTLCDECRPVTTCYACGPGYTTSYGYGTSTAAPTSQQQPVTTITSGTVVYIVYGATSPAAAGQVTATNGVVQVISASGSTGPAAHLLSAGLALALLALVMVLAM
jgi:hypothetical protein